MALNDYKGMERTKTGIQKHSILPWLLGMNSTNKELEWNQGWFVKK